MWWFGCWFALVVWGMSWGFLCSPLGSYFGTYFGAFLMKKIEAPGRKYSLKWVHVCFFCFCFFLGMVVHSLGLFGFCNTIFACTYACKYL